MRGDGDFMTMVAPRNEASLRVLVAEDNPVNQFLLQTILEATGCAVDVAGDGRAAVELALCHEYDLVLMDQHMPVMGGPEAVAAIRRLDLAMASVPIIAVITDSRDAGQFSDGVDEFVSKPFDPVRLFDAISHVTGFTPSQPILADIIAGLAAIRAPAGEPRDNAALSMD